MLPQRLGGRDLFWWLTRLGLLRVTVTPARPADEPPGLCDRDQPARLERAGVRFRPLVDAEGRTVRFADHSLLEDVGWWWATGYRSDYAWIHVPGVVREGHVVHRRGVTEVPRPVFPGPVLAAHPRVGPVGLRRRRCRVSGRPHRRRTGTAGSASAGVTRQPSR